MGRPMVFVAVWLSAGCLFPPCGVMAATTYYVSRSTGSDACDGLAAKRTGLHGPWRTLAKASSVSYAAGDRLLLASGDTWRETLALRGAGTVAAPVLVAPYGTGPRPAIHGPTFDVPCVLLDKCGGWRITGLEMAYARNAVRVVADSRVSAQIDGVEILDCFFHDIENPAFPDPAKREGSQHNHLRAMGYALFVDGFDSPGPVKLSRVRVKNCVALWTQGFYIHVMGPISADDVRFDGNTLSHVSYNAIYQAGGRRFDILNSVFVYGYPWADYPNGATQALAGGLDGDATTRNTVGNNEFGWGGEYPGRPDGCAYDFEGTTNGVAFVNNLIHDTFGEPVLFMGGFAHKDLLFEGNVLRNNVRFKTRWDANVTVTNSNGGNGTFRNNRFYLRPGKRAFSQKSPAYDFVNNDENAAGEFTAMPLVTRIDRRGGARIYTLASRTPGASIRYTTDGSLPNPSSPVYTRPVVMNRSGALNAKAFSAGRSPSYVNCIVVDMGDKEGRSPVASWEVGGRARAPVDITSVADTFTISMWVAPRAERLSTPESNQGVVGESGQQFAVQPAPVTAAHEASVAISVGTNGVSVFESADGYRPCMLTDDCVLNGWRHITVVYREKQPGLYLDGVYEKAGRKSTRSVRPRFTVDARFSGKVRDVRLYDRVLTDAEIQALAAAPPRS